MNNKNLVIVEMETISIFDFVKEGETVDEAENRANQHYVEGLERVKSLFQDSDDDKSRAYWKEQITAYEKKIQAGCQVIFFETFKKMQKEKLLSDKLTEITAEKFEDAFDVLPPLCWCTIDDVEMFCMSEMYSDTYTTQYAHDHRTGKYYCKMVDSADKSTWIHKLLRKC